METLKLLAFENRLGNKEEGEASKDILSSLCCHIYVYKKPWAARDLHSRILPGLVKFQEFFWSSGNLPLDRLIERVPQRTQTVLGIFILLR